MENTKHTPGPWHLSIPTDRRAGFNTNRGKCIGVYATNNDLEAIAQVYQDRMLFHKTQSVIANAKLIAAAPDLLEALQTILINVPAYILHEYTELGFNKSLDAIKKATE